MGRPPLHHRPGRSYQRGRDDAAGGEGPGSKVGFRMSDFGFRVIFGRSRVSAAAHTTPKPEIRNPTSLCVLVLLLLCGCARPTESSQGTALRRGCQYLWSQQAEDGGWHSRTYGLLKSGQSLSGFILDALLQVPEQTCKPPAGGKDRAVKFLKHNT